MGSTEWIPHDKVFSVILGVFPILLMYKYGWSRLEGDGSKLSSRIFFYYFAAVGENKLWLLSQIKSLNLPSSYTSAALMYIATRLSP